MQTIRGAVAAGAFAIGPEMVALLKRLPLFSGLSEELLRFLLADATVHAFPRNRVVFLQGDAANAFFVIFEGWVKLFRESLEGQESVIAVFGRGESFAEAAIFESHVYPVSASMVEDGELLAIPAKSFIKRVEENSALALNMMAAMSRHQRHLVSQIERLSTRSSVERLAEFLVRLSPTADTAATVRLPLDKTLIAARLGMKPETLSRGLAKLRQLGVETSGNTVVIPDLAALRALVGADGVTH